MSNSDYDPDAYWSERLKGDFSLRGTGHIGYSERYNRWLYKAKRRAFRQALNAIPLPAQALDVGSGNGWVIRELIRAGAAVRGSDLTSIAVARLRRAFPTVEFDQFAIGRDRIPQPDASLDLVTVLDVLYHVRSDQEWSAGVRDIARVLRPGGHLVVSDRMGKCDEQPAPHVRFRSRARWEDEANKAGLELSEMIALYRWFARDRSAGPPLHLPDGARGALEYALERLQVGSAHMWCAVLTRLQPRAV